MAVIPTTPGPASPSVPRPPGDGAPRLDDRDASTAGDLLAVAAAAGVSRLPRRLALALGGALGWVVWALAPRKRRRTMLNLRRTGLPGPARRCRLAWQGIGRTFVEMLWLTGRSADEALARVNVDGLDVLREAASTGRGVLLVSGHVGNWELVSLAAARSGVPVAVIARPLRAPRLERRLLAFRERGGVRTLLRGRPGASVAASRWLARGGVLGCMMDRLSSGPRLAVPFLGGATRMPLGPARLAGRYGAAVVLGWAVRRPDATVDVSFRRLETEGRDARGVVRVVGEGLDRAVRDTPEQWLWIYRRQPRRDEADDEDPPASGEAASV